MNKVYTCHCEHPTFDLDAPYSPLGYYCGTCGLWVDDPVDKVTLQEEHKPGNFYEQD